MYFLQHHGIRLNKVPFTSLEHAMREGNSICINYGYLPEIVPVTTTAYKLVRKLKSGEISPLFINKKMRIPFGEWLDAECHPTKGFAVRPFWNCTAEMLAPHLSMKGRQWALVEISDFEEKERPECQGGKWYLAKRIKFIKLL